MRFFASYAFFRGHKLPSSDMSTNGAPLYQPRLRSVASSRRIHAINHRSRILNLPARLEPRSRWPRGSPCAGSWALVRGSPGAKLTLEVSFHNGKKHLPVVALKRAA